MKHILKTKYKLSIFLIFVLVVQLLGPIVGNYVVADDRKGRDLGGEEGFEYEVGLKIRVDNQWQEVAPGSVIDLSKIDSIGYNLEFIIRENFEIELSDSIKLDVSDLREFAGLELIKGDLEGEIVFKLSESKGEGAGEEQKVKAASYRVNEDNQLIIIFDDAEGIEKLNKHNIDRKGLVELEFIKDKVEDEVEVLEEIEIKDKEEKTFYIKRNYQVEEKNVVKSGSYNEMEDVIVWTIDINKHLEDLSNAVLIDEIPEGLKVDKVEIADLSLKIKGDKTIVSEGEYSEASYSADENEIKIELGDLKKEAKRIKITTSLIDASKTEFDFTNNVTLEAENDTEVSDSSVVSGTRTATIEKIGEVMGNIIKWTIKYRGTGEEELMVDTPDLDENIGLVYVEGSAKVKGEDKKIQVSVDEPSESLIFSNLPNVEGHLYTLTFKTEVIYKDNFNPSQDNTIEIKNKVNYGDNSTDTTVEVSRGQRFKKELAKVYGKNNETYIDWNITLNQNNEPWKNVVVKEYIPEGFKFVKAKLDKKKIENINKDQEPIEINIGSLDKESILTVTTQLIDPDKISQGSKNQAEVSWGLDVGEDIGIGLDNLEDSYNSRIESPISRENLTHRLSKKNTSIDYKEGKTAWEVEYEGFDTTIEGLEIEDQLTDGFTKGNGSHMYDEGSFKITINDNEYELKVGTEETITIEDKNLSYDLSLDDSKRSFTLIIHSETDINEYYNKVILTYDTGFALSEMLDQEDSLVLKNQVSIDNKGQSGSMGEKVSIKDYISKNGKKSGKWTKEGRQFDWIVELNHKGKEIPKEEKIIDELSDYQKYEGDIEIYKAELSEDGRLSQKDKLDKGSNYEIEFREDQDKNGDLYHKGMEIKFTEDLSHPIIIKYNTKAVGESREYYENSIKYNDEDKIFEDSVKYDNYNKNISKELLNGMILDNKDPIVMKGDVIRWKLVVNESLSTIHNFELKDIMNEALVFIEDSLLINGKPYTEQNEFKLSTEFEDNKNGFKLNKTFVDEKYTIEYETLVIGDFDAEEISNNVQVTGGNIQAEIDTENSYKIWSRSQAYGSGYRRDGSENNNDYSISIKKVNEAGDIIDNSGERFQAKFELITVTNIGDKTYLDIDKFTTEEGRLEFEVNKNNYSKYYLREIEPPIGYKSIEDIDMPRVFIGDDFKEITLKRMEVEDDGQVTISDLTSKNGHIVIPLELNHQTDQEIIISVENKKIKTEVTAKKDWVGGSSLMKPKIQLQLYRDNNKEGAPVTLDGSEGWIYTWRNLDKYNDIDGKEYVYTVKEIKIGDVKAEENKVIDNYQPTVIEGRIENNYTIRNTYVIPKTSQSVRIKWVYGPELTEDTELIVQLYRQIDLKGKDKKELEDKEIVLNKDNNWTYTWEGLDKTDEEGNEYIYTVGEKRVPENYRDDYTIDEVDGSLVITNTYISPKTEVKVEKEWVGGPADKPPIEVQLYRDGEKYKEPVTLDGSEGWTYTWTDLDERDKNGNKYRYSVDEITGPENYGKSIEVDEENQITTITNTYNSPVTDIRARKLWELVPKEKPTIQLQLYRDGEVMEGEEYLVTLEDGQYEYTWKDMPVTDENGIYYQYSIDEVQVPEGYRKIISEDGLTITNKYDDPEEPTFIKDIEGATKKDIEDGESFTYNVSMDFPTDISGYESLLIADILEEVLEIESVEVQLDGVRSRFLEKYLTVEGNQVYLLLYEEDGFDFSIVAGRTINMEIKAKIKEGADLSPYLELGIPNTATYRLNDREIIVSSETVTVTPPEPEKPELPSTGTNRAISILLYIIGFIALILGFILFKRPRQE